MKSIKFCLAIALLFSSNVRAQINSPLQKVLQSYIAVKDALIKSDKVAAASLSKDFFASIETINKTDLNSASQDVWTKVESELKQDAKHLSETKELSLQRNHFVSLSKNLYAVIKVSSIGQPVYYQTCPMANKGKGANWLSLENKIKNPYYGNQMLTCGEVIETIQ